MHSFLFTEATDENNLIDRDKLLNVEQDVKMLVAFFLSLHVESTPPDNE